MGDVKFSALDACSDYVERLKFWANDNPVCPHCGETFSVDNHEWWSLYEEGEHEITCPDCDWDFQVTTRVSYTFSTDNQERDDEPTPTKPGETRE
jgi:transposase-like protein